MSLMLWPKPDLYIYLRITSLHKSLPKCEVMIQQGIEANSNVCEKYLFKIIND